MGNNPLKYVDPSGEEPITMGAFLIGAAIGALVGSTTSALIYSASAGSSWTWSGFGRAALTGAISGAISGGIGAFAPTGALAQNLAFGVVRQSAANISTRLIMGENLSAGMIVGSAVSGLINGAIPGFTGVNGGPVANIAAELFYNVSRGAFGGGIGGVVGAAISGGDIAQGMVNGAISGGIAAAAHTSLVLASWGPAFNPGENYGYGGKYAPVDRSGGIVSAIILGKYQGYEGTGIAVGRNLVGHPYTKLATARADKFTSIIDGNRYLFAHETAHYHQQMNMGFAQFYAEAIPAQFRYFFGGPDPYNTPGTLEYSATIFGKRYLTWSQW